MILNVCYITGKNNIAENLLGLIIKYEELYLDCRATNLDR